MLRIDGTQIRTIPVVFNTKGRMKTLDSDSDDLYHFPSLSPARAYLIEEDSKGKEWQPIIKRSSEKFLAFQTTFYHILIILLRLSFSYKADFTDTGFTRGFECLVDVFVLDCFISRNRYDGIRIFLLLGFQT